MYDPKDKDYVFTGVTCCIHKDCERCPYKGFTVEGSFGTTELGDCEKELLIDVRKILKPVVYYGIIPKK